MRWVLSSFAFDAGYLVLGTVLGLHSEPVLEAATLGQQQVPPKLTSKAVQVLP